MRTVSRVRERALFVSPRTPSELELQARWFAGEFGKHFVSTSGDTVDIVQFGVWNREAGPDFRDAAISLNGMKPIRGCIEIDLLDRNWEAHGHATNPAFEETVLHVFVEKNPQPNVGNFILGPRAGRAQVSTRIRLADSQKVVAIAKLSDGS